MIYFTVSGWFYYKPQNGEYQILLKGEPTTTTNLLFSCGSASNRNVAEAMLPELRKNFNSLVEEVAKKSWISEYYRKKLIA